jgi:holin-like protein
MGLCVRGMLKTMLGLLILVAFQLAGVGLHRLGVPLPSGVLGLLLFTAALATGAVKLKWVEGTADFLVRHMLLLFIPLMVGLTQVFGLLRHDWLALIASLVVSLLAVLFTAGGMAHFLLRDDAVDDFAEADEEQIG